MEIKQKKVWLSLIVLYAITTSVLGDFGEPLLKGFYKESCPASLLRLQFHDCFVLVRKSSLSTLLTSSFVRFYNCSLRDDNFIKYFWGSNSSILLERYSKFACMRVRLSYCVYVMFSCGIYCGFRVVMRLCSWTHMEICWVRNKQLQIWTLYVDLK